MSLEEGILCYFLDPERSWILGYLQQWDGKTGSCKAKEGGPTVGKLSDDDLFVPREDCIDEDVDDLLHLTILHDATLLACLRTRYFRDVIYTNIGAILVAINPFNFNIPWYMDSEMPKYLAEGDRIERNIPHSWAQAHNTYWEMRGTEMNQTILVSGESGAGKTEASKIVFKYLGALSCLQGTDEEKAAGLAVGTKINKASPPLEAFGNAKTVRNDNSSRFGKFMKVKFDGKGYLVGAHITKYLLEKSRIVTAMPNERLYHSFYLLCRSTDREQYRIGSDKDFRSLMSGGDPTNKDYDTTEDYEEVVGAMATIGIGGDDITSTWKVVAGVMHLLNVEFESDGGEGSLLTSSSTPAIENCVTNFMVDGERLQYELLKTEMEVMNQVITKLLRPSQAVDGRDALCKTIYDEQFAWLIESCNTMLDVECDGSWIGLLDIFGFEDFDVNSFEQLCINLANETLQGHYNSYIFEKDMDECRSEGIDVTKVEFPDNSPCLAMIAGNGGILSLLDEQCAVGSGTDEAFLYSIEEKHRGNPFFAKKTLAVSSFIVHHYAGSVSYEVEGFLDKNRDTLKDAWKTLMRSSSDAHIAALLPEPCEKSTRATVGTFFKNQLRDLMDLINSTNPHWIRCVKPHPAKRPRMFHGVQTMKQLASAGVLGTVKIRKAGYPVRIPFDDFVARYKIISGAEPIDPTPADGCCDLAVKVMQFAPEQCQIGKTRVFMKTEAYVELEQRKKEALLRYALICQAFARGYASGTHTVRCLVLEKNKGVVDSLREMVRAVKVVMKSEASARYGIENDECIAWEEAEVDFVDRVEALRRHELLEAERIRQEEEERRRREEAIRREAEEELRRRREAEERKRAMREMKRLEQIRKERALQLAQAALKKDKYKEVQKEIKEIREQRAEVERLECEKMAEARRRHEEKVEMAERRQALAAQRRSEKEAEQQEEVETVARNVFEKQKWADLLTARSKMDKQQQSFERGLQSQLHHADGKARVKADEQLFLRLTEAKQSEEFRKDVNREIERQRREAAVQEKRRQQRLQRAQRRRLEEARLKHMKKMQMDFEREQLKTRQEWEYLLKQEEHRRSLRSFKQAQESREENKMLDDMLQRMDREMKLQAMEERRLAARAQSEPPRLRSKSAGGTKTADTYVELGGIKEIDDELHSRLMGHERTAAAGTLNDPLARVGYSDNLPLGVEKPRVKLHWKP